MNVPGTITVRTYYTGPTETKGSRMRAVARLDNNTRRQLTIPFPYEANNADTEVACRLAESLGYDRSRVVWVASGAYVINTETDVNGHPCEGGDGECPNACQCGCGMGQYECACD